MTAQDIALLIAAVGGGAILPKAFDALWKALSGRAGRERDAVAYERGRADRADERADEANARAEGEASTRRRVNEHASRLRRQLIDLGVRDDEIPGWPEATNTIKKES